MFTVARALANRLGQMVSTSTLAALSMIDLLSGYWNVIICQDESEISTRKLVDAHVDFLVDLFSMDA